MKTPKCPKCNNDLKIFESSCYDDDCCGLRDEIFCTKCNYVYSSAYDIDLINELFADLIKKANLNE